MPIRKHGKGWEVRIQHDGLRHSKTVATRADALYLEAKLRQRFQDSRSGRTPQYAFKEALERWLIEEHPRLRSPHTSLVKAILPHVAKRTLSDVPGLAEAIKKHAQSNGIGPAAINRRLALVKRIAKLAFKRWKWLDRDYGAEIELVPGEVRRTEWVTKEEALKLMKCADPDIREAIRWAVLTGLRRGEILTMQPHYFKDRVAYLPISKSGKPRAVPLPPELDPADFPFGLNATRLDKGFQAARRKAGMPRIRFHDLRRSYGTWLIQGGADLAGVRDLLGHANAAMTSRYLGSSVEHMKKLVTILPRLSAGKSRGKNLTSKRGNGGKTKNVQPGGTGTGVRSLEGAKGLKRAA